MPTTKSSFFWRLLNGHAYSITRNYTTKLSMSQLSTVHRGTQFEDRSMALLKQHLSMSLTRVGGKGDGGIDMLGWWWVPLMAEDASISKQRRRIRVIAQCKAEKKKVGPKYVRELEGVLHRYYTSDLLREEGDRAHLDHHPPAGLHTVSQFKHVSAIGLLVSESSFTKATVLHAQSSPIPLLLLHLPPEDKESLTSSPTSHLGSAVWNPALAGDHGLLGGQMEIRWERSIQDPGRPGLWWRNAKLPSWLPSEV